MPKAVKPKSETLVSTIKIELTPVANAKEATQFIKNLSIDCGKAANLAVTELFSLYCMANYLKDKKVFGEAEGKGHIEGYIKANNIADCSMQTLPYRVIGRSYPDMPSFVKTPLANAVYKNFKSDYYEITKGLRSPRNYKSNLPVPLNWSKNHNKEHIDYAAQQLRINKVDDDYILKIFDFEYKMVFGTKRRNLLNDHRVILDRVWNKIYDYGDASVEIKDKKIYLLLPYKFTRDQVALDKTLVMGVDLGIKSAIAYGFNRDVNPGLITGKILSKTDENVTLFDYRKKLGEEYRVLNKSVAVAKGGRGRGHKLKALDRLKQKERNYAQTAIHQLSAQLIKVAVKHGAGVIHLELLEGIARDEQQKTLRYWSYFEMQQRIKEKAAKFGIEVLHIDPYLTSQRCSTCGHMEAGQRSKEDTESFACKNIECDDYRKIRNADINAAINIAKCDKVVTEKWECYKMLTKENKERYNQGLPLKKNKQKEFEECLVD